MPVKTFDQFELWGSIDRQNRHLRRNNWFHWVVHLVLVGVLVLVTMRPPLAIRVDQLGRAEYVPTAPALAAQPSAEEAEHVARLVATYLLEVTSGSVGRDLQKALALMTANFERAYREKLRDDPVPAAIEHANVRTALSFTDNASEIKAEHDTQGRVVRYFVTLEARMDLFRADVLTAPLHSRDVVIRTTLLVVPRSKRTLNGLLVDFFERSVLDAPAAPAVNVNPLAVPQGVAR